MRTLEQRRGELFGLAAFLAGLAVVPLPSFLKSPSGSERELCGRGRNGRDGEEEEEEEGGWGFWKGGLPLVGAVLGAWAMLGEL